MILSLVNADELYINCPCLFLYSLCFTLQVFPVFLRLCSPWFELEAPDHIEDRLLREHHLEQSVLYRVIFINTYLDK